MLGRLRACLFSDLPRCRPEAAQTEVAYGAPSADAPLSSPSRALPVAPAFKCGRGLQAT